MHTRNPRMARDLAVLSAGVLLLSVGEADVYAHAGRRGSTAHRESSGNRWKQPPIFRGGQIRVLHERDRTAALLDAHGTDLTEKLRCAP